MKIKDLHIKKNDKIPFRLLSMERNPNNNLFLIVGQHFFKVQQLKDNNDFIEEKVTIKREIKTIKYATWGRTTGDIIYFYDSNKFFLHSLDLNSNVIKKYNYQFNNDISHLSINCNDSIMACCSKDKDNKIYLLDLKNDIIRSEIIPRNIWKICDCQFSPIDENYFLLSGDGGNIYLYDIRNESKQVRDFCSESKEILSVSWHPLDKDIFCSGGMDNYIRIWDIKKNNMNSLAEFKTSAGCSKVNFLKSNPNYLISVYQNINNNINLWNIKMRDMPEYRFRGHESSVIGLDTDKNGTRIISIDKKGILIVHDLNKGERILDDITTNIINFNNHNEIYCFHDEKLEKENFSKIYEKIQEKNQIIIDEENNHVKDIQDNINNIYMLNFNQKDMQIMNKSPTKDDKLLHLKKDTILILNNELKQYYIFTPEQIHSLFRGYIYYIEKKENLYKRKRFQSVNDLNKFDKNLEPITVDELDFSQKLNISISKNLTYATNHVKNYNHISIWKTLLNLSEKTTFKLIYNKLIGKEQKYKKGNTLNKSFEKEKEYYEIRHKKLSSSDSKMMTNLIIKQLSKIIEYLIDDYGDIYLATIICYLFKPFLFHDEKIKKRTLRLIKECVLNLRKYQLYIEANHLIKYGPKENNIIDKNSFRFNYSCVDCEQYQFKDGKCRCGKVIACKECEKKISGLFLWCPSCGHEEHLNHINKNKAELYCNICKKRYIIDN